MQQISKYFEKANLPLVVTNEPFARGRGVEEIFQMTIEGKKKEQFKIFKGVGTDVRVLDVDKDRRQVLLFVKEPKREFTEVRYDRKQGKTFETIRQTSEGIKRYLAGMDERHLFISELPHERGKINTVEDAHRWLKPVEVKDTKKKKDSKVIRQGEWFFVDVNPEERLLINEKAEWVLPQTALPTRGKPHTADYLLNAGGKIFIKGKVRHADHKTIEFVDWQRVYRNTERIANTYGWID
jgi:hypothetical protein